MTHNDLLKFNLEVSRAKTNILQAIPTGYSYAAVMTALAEAQAEMARNLAEPEPQSELQIEEATARLWLELLPEELPFTDPLEVEEFSWPAELNRQLADVSNSQERLEKIRNFYGD
jgi:hypothetical protein